MKPSPPNSWAEQKALEQKLRKKWLLEVITYYPDFISAAAALGTTSLLLAKSLKRNGVEPPKSFTRIRKQLTKEKILPLVEAGHTQVEIANLLGCSTSAVSLALKRHNLRELYHEKQKPQKVKISFWNNPNKGTPNASE